MKRILSALRFLAVLAALVPAAAHAQAPQPPEIAARSYLLFDVTANQLLATKDIDAPVDQASLTKLMTGYLVFDALRSRKISLAQKLPVSPRAWKMPGSRMFIDPKMQVPVGDLIQGMVVQSGNDATIALAEGVGGTVENFVRLMNEQAKALGMNATSYKNPEGLTEPGHTSTARDLSVLATRLMKDFPEYMHYYATKRYSYPGTPTSNSSNRNMLLFRDPTVDGLKTGHTDAAGYCLVATSRREFPGLGQRRLLSIVLGAASENARANESQKLLNWGYTAFDAVKLFDAGQAVATPDIWKGRENQLRIGREEAIVVAIPAGSAGKISTRIARPDPLVAPYTKGQSIGTLEVMLGDQALGKVPLVALEGVEQAGMWGRAWDALRLWIR
ncbi:D-alanyl-D-alanine carboxypeptidase family protein [Verminephrobacter aporrectodeae]|uniref:serine-type D-Ala-D-Ala carboxypeptidase n=1 Tax=Verminephrobacter aporrectodeae subsp. tuberculatae TaxID=1110392 RepID=A0ABT3KPY5_9BURK|nr:D-alanyl-D-alanine carboxypeptidase family protein [Verminephrobacter aporrectodeae]MCW5220648.1 D-alanyl-D-alanine carboxypeptidase [Verminephrobacter aporrectodeae subsp. tuberculatae]MCW5255400.1 D-alanyl-D-alanine carboxypeptidase [Verminephrobacter aporrectodeae subsp. tuberculatae]MCW5289943.1 D-alanyl-D-alanine carboxypeptidase [Verminephrobacter aporrectodeae subsp. tuberculatae]MCW5320382.1 D-alanyl-D-alanine carboxypeptidase [Verminephrobacter aporrectodeae subsp. tuberculatae]MCW